MAVSKVRVGPADLDFPPQTAYTSSMSQATRPVPALDDDNAELAALTAAVAEARADRRAIPHSRVRAWLLEITAGNFDAPPPEGE